MRDQRDPLKLGELYLTLRRKYEGEAVETLMKHLAQCECPNYDSEHIGPIEKYGDPRGLPSTLPN